MRNFIFLLLFALIGCGPGDDDKPQSDSVNNQPQGLAITSGTVTGLSCKLNVGTTCEVYLPVSFQPDSLYPVLIFFDRAGDGKVPVEKYKSLADKWEFILVGSNYTKNGMESTMAMTGGNELVTDV